MASVLTSIVGIPEESVRGLDSRKTPWRSQKNPVHGVPLMNQIRELELHAVQILVHILIHLFRQPSHYTSFCTLKLLHGLFSAEPCHPKRDR